MKILIIGVTGMLGHQMYRILDANFPGQVWGTIRKNKSDLISAFDFIPRQQLIENIDITDFDSVQKMLSAVKPDLIVNCTGVTLRKADSQNIEQCYRINSVFPQKLALWARNNQSRLIHFSTDCVFDGKQGGYTEASLPTALDHYGQSKFLGEAAGASALTIRLSIIGRELGTNTELVEWFLLQKGKTVNGYSEVYYSGVTTQFAANEVVRIIKNFPELAGLYQLASERISKFELLKLINQKFGTQTEIKDDSSKHSDKSLNCDLYIKKTGFKKPTWEQLISDLHKDNSFYENAKSR